jgi:hypothetical protein
MSKACHNITAFPLKRPLESTLVRAAMLLDGITRREMAEGCGISPESFSAQLATKPSESIRPRIEAIFGYRRPIWSDANTLRQRKACVEKYGIDPFLICRADLRALAVTRSLRPATHLPQLRIQILDALLATDPSASTTHKSK